MAGGTVITLHGSGFASDAYTSSNVVWFDGPDIRVPCDFIRCVHMYTCHARIESISHNNVSLKDINNNYYFNGCKCIHIYTRVILTSRIDPQ